MLQTILKRGLSALLVLVLVASLLPIAAFADETVAYSDLIEGDYPHEVNDGHTHVAKLVDRVPPLCDEPGRSAGSCCSLCGLIISGCVEIDPLGHGIEYFDAQLPTFNNPGWDAYESCYRCGYTTKVEYPALERPYIEDFESFVFMLALLEEAANMYVAEIDPNQDPLNLVIKYIRTGVERYNSGSWGIMAGYENAEFAQFVAILEDEMNLTASSVDEMLSIGSLKLLKNITLPNGDVADLGHMFGTMDITYHNNFGVNHADVGGWAGDLVDLLELSDYIGISGTLNEMIEKINEKAFLMIAPEGIGGFSKQDLIGDLDALYVMENIRKNGYQFDTDLGTGLYVTLMLYFTEDLSMEDRAAFFLKNRMDGITVRSELREAVYNAYSTNKVITTLEGTRDFNSDDLANLRKAVCYAYADYMCKLAGDYVEIGENNLYTPFSSESAVLAPGITQQINLATTKQGKQLSYYLAIADLTREDVHLYANYNENDPSQGWAMQRVEDQANAAQERHSDPESEHYIENYTVIAATNGSGFNMTTGEPSGVLVMEGVEYQKISSAGFVGILKDGTPVIGTAEEYNTIYKGQVQEAIACFGTRLIKNGKIVEGLTDVNYAPRTAIGFTKTGKVVLLVVDGRQEPFSAGCDFATLAQILLEAGCVEATNLDGGGSTTYVARQPGEDALSLVNVPSDGIARSVSTSLMLVSTAPSSTAFDHAVIESAYDRLTKNTSVQLTAVGISPSGNTVDIPEGAVWEVSDPVYGYVAEDGVFTGLRNGSVDVYLTLDGEIIAAKTMSIVTPENIFFSKTNVDMVYGETATLPVKLYFQGKEIAFNSKDIIFSVANPTAGSISGLTFTANTDSGLSNTTVTAMLASNNSVMADVKISLYKQGELTFDFDQATGGDRELAWHRVVSNTTTEDGITFTVENPEEPMEVSYILAIDMTQIPFPGRLGELSYMLPGADQAGACPWTFLCSLAERISPMTEIQAVVHYNPEFKLDLSEMKLINECFELANMEVDEENGVLTLTLKWIRQTHALDSNVVNPICIVNGLKLIPREDADWGSKSQIKASISATVSYKIYMRASALYSFSAKAENQEAFGLYSYVNPDVPTDKGGYFASTYKTFSDSFTLVNQLKSGWFVGDGGYVYYADGVMLTGVQKVDGLYYNFGDNGVIATQTPYTGLFVENGNTYYAKGGEIGYGWVSLNNEWYLFNWSTGVGTNGTYTEKIDGITVTYEFENGKLVKGYWHRDENGLQYFYGPYYQKQGWITIDGREYYFEGYYAATGLYPVRAAHAVNATWYVFEETGALVGPAEDGLHWYEGSLYYIKNQSSNFNGLISYNGNYYYASWDNSLYTNGSYWISSTGGALKAGYYRFDAEGKILMDTGLVQEADGLYYYKNGCRAGGAGLILVDGDYYYIDGAAKAVCNKTVWVSNTNGYVTAEYYTFGADGKMVRYNGIVDGRYYVDGEGVAKGLIQVDGNYYYAQWGGYLVQSKTFWISNTNGLLEKGYYRFDAEGKILMDTAIVEENGSLYYYCNGMMTNNAGLVLLDGDYYHIDVAATAQRNVTVWVQKTNGLLPAGYYNFGADGKMIRYNGIVDGCYYVDGVGTNAGLLLIDGEYYFTQWGGYLAMNQSCWVGNTNGLVPAGTYTFDAEGKMVRYNGIVDGRYYVDGVGTAKGLIQVDGNYYYAQWGGYLTVSQSYWVGNTNGLLEKGYYRFDAEGKILMDTDVVDENGTLYYYENGLRKPGAGLVKIGEDYYFIANGAIPFAGGELWVEKTNNLLPKGDYIFGDDGKLQKYNGIVDGRYYVNGVGTSAGLICIDGEYYFAAYNGNLIRDQIYWVGRTNDLLPEGEYMFDAEGKIIRYNGIVDGRYYEDGVGTAKGLIYLDGNYYYTQWGGYLVTDKSFWISTTNGLLEKGYYRFDAEGKLLLDTVVVEEEGTLYYYENGLRKPGAGLVKIGEDYYFIGNGAIAYTDGKLWVEKTNNLLPKGDYVFGADGKLQKYNGVVNGRYYVDGIGTNAGLICIDGEYYFAGYDGNLVTNQIYWVTRTNGLLPEGEYDFGADGKILKHNGIVNGRYYVNGIGTNAGLICIDGEYYFAGYGGNLVKNQKYWVSRTNGLLTAGEYTFDADGKIIF